jgi:hypothetical protein
MRHWRRCAHRLHGLARQKRIQQLRRVIRELGKQIPAAKQSDPGVEELATFGCGATMHVLRLLTARWRARVTTKDIDFTGGVRARWQAGYEDTLAMIQRAPWNEPIDPLPAWWSSRARTLKGRHPSRRRTVRCAGEVMAWLDVALSGPRCVPREGACLTRKVDLSTAGITRLARRSARPTSSSAPIGLRRPPLSQPRATPERRAAQSLRRERCRLSRCSRAKRDSALGQHALGERAMGLCAPRFDVSVRGRTALKLQDANTTGLQPVQWSQN